MEMSPQFKDTNELHGRVKLLLKRQTLSLITCTKIIWQTKDTVYNLETGNAEHHYST